MALVLPDLSEVDRFKPSIKVSGFKPFTKVAFFLFVIQILISDQIKGWGWVKVLAPKLKSKWVHITQTKLKNNITQKTSFQRGK